MYFKLGPSVTSSQEPPRAPESGLGTPYSSGQCLISPPELAAFWSSSPQLLAQCLAQNGNSLQGLMQPRVRLLGQGKGRKTKFGERIIYSNLSPPLPTPAKQSTLNLSPDGLSFKEIAGMVVNVG